MEKRGKSEKSEFASHFFGYLNWPEVPVAATPGTHSCCGEKGLGGHRQQRDFSECPLHRDSKAAGRVAGDRRGVYEVRGTRAGAECA